MIDLQRAIDTSKSYAILREKSRHPFWQRCQDLTRKYRAFITGEDIKYMLEQFDRRENKEDFEQACRIAKQVTPAITAALMNPPRKVAATRPRVDRIDYGQENDTKADELRTAIATFYGGQSVDHYLSTLIDPSDIDPNAFQLLTFDEFDPRFEKPTVYPLSIPSYNIWDFSYLNGELEWLWMGFDIKYVTKPAVLDSLGNVVTKEEEASGMRMVFYTHSHHIHFEQVEKNTAKGIKNVITDAEGNPMAAPVFSDGRSTTDFYLKTEDEHLYRVRFYEQKSGRVPAFRLGCKADPLTDGKTCVNRWHEAVPYLEKNLKHVRELDLSIALHTFPQKIQYVSKCRAFGCNGGLLSDGNVTCGSCKGSGFSTIGTAQDHITLPLPKPGDEIIDPAKIIHYVPVPIDIVTKLMEIVREDRSDAFKAVYGSDLYGQGNVGKTYEEVLAQNQAMYDALQPFAQWWSNVRTRVVQVYASYNDAAQGLVVIHKLPQAFGFENAGTIFSMMKGALEAGASKSVLANLNASVISIAFRDDDQALAKAQTQAKFDPFPGMTQDTVVTLISGGRVTDKERVMWQSSASVFAQAEAKYTGEVSFYDLAEAKQREVIDKILDTMIEEQPADPALEPMLGVDETAIDGPPVEDPNAAKVQDTALNGAQFQALSDVIVQVATGVLTKETASAMIRAGFPGIPEQLVSSMLSTIKDVTPEQVKMADRVADTRDTAGTTQPAAPVEQAA